MIKNLGEHRILTQLNKNWVVLDFNPLLNSLVNYPKFQELQPKNFLISHWNKILSLPAYYCPQTGEYLAAKETQIKVECSEHFWVGFNRKDFPNVLPSSGLLYPNAIMIKVNDTLIIDKLNNKTNENIYDSGDSSLDGASNPSLSTLDSPVG